jgi:hypothetical protein
MLRKFTEGFNCRGLWVSKEESFRILPVSSVFRASPRKAFLSQGGHANGVQGRGVKALDRTSETVTRQIGAMGAAVYEVGLYKPEAEAEGKAVMIPRTWDVDNLLRSIKWLRLQNLEGRNIYVRPKGEHSLSLVDDLTADAIRRMKSGGFHPTVVVETSPGNFQAWLKHPRQLPRDLNWHSTATAGRLRGRAAYRSGGARGTARPGRRTVQL